MSIDEEFFGKTKKAKKTPGVPGIDMNVPLAPNTVTGTIGLELELEGRGLPNAGHLEKVKGKTTGATWNVVPDGSLRGGQEYVLNRPCDVKEIEPLVTGLFDTFNALGVVVENTNRCSTHVHINMGGCKINELTAALALWTTFEQSLIEWCGEMRKTNHFCLSAKDVVSVMEAWTQFLQTGALPLRNTNLKYTAMNILPLWRYGSFEVRCGPAADSPDIPVKWATFLHHFIKYAITEFSNPRTLAYALSERGGREIFVDICTKAGLVDFANEVFYKSPDFDRLCIDGFRNAQPFVMGFPWDEWMDDINREYVPNPFSSGKKKVTLADLDPMRATGTRARPARFILNNDGQLIDRGRPQPVGEPGRVVDPEWRAMPPVNPAAEDDF